MQTMNELIRYLAPLFFGQISKGALTLPGPGLVVEETVVRGTTTAPHLLAAERGEGQGARCHLEGEVPCARQLFKTSSSMGLGLSQKPGMVCQWELAHGD